MENNKDEIIGTVDLAYETRINEQSALCCVEMLKRSLEEVEKKIEAGEYEAVEGNELFSFNMLVGQLNGDVERLKYIKQIERLAKGNTEELSEEPNCDG